MDLQLPGSGGDRPSGSVSLHDSGTGRGNRCVHCLVLWERPKPTEGKGKLAQTTIVDGDGEHPHEVGDGGDGFLK